MSQQLVKKGANGKHENVMPRSWIEAIKDKSTGQTLVEILQGFNMYFLSYNGNPSATRCLVPTMLRKKGLWITYVKYDGNVYTEWYAVDEIDDTSWGDSSNWRVGNNTLVGDITISANGNWVINGTETEFKAIGEKGNTPLVRFGSNNKFQVSYNNGAEWLDISNSITNNLRIKKYIGINESLPTSGIEEGTIYMKGPYYAEDDTLNDNPIYRLWVYAWKGNTLAWQDNGEFTSIAAGVVQETGDSETEVMSQKAVSDELYKFTLDEVETVGGEMRPGYAINWNNGYYFVNANYTSGLAKVKGGSAIRILADGVVNKNVQYVIYSTFNIGKGSYVSGGISVKSYINIPSGQEYYYLGVTCPMKVEEYTFIDVTKFPKRTQALNEDINSIDSMLFKTGSYEVTMSSGYAINYNNGYFFPSEGWTAGSLLVYKGDKLRVLADKDYVYPIRYCLYTRDGNNFIKGEFSVGSILTVPDDLDVYLLRIAYEGNITNFNVEISDIVSSTCSLSKDIDNINQKLEGFKTIETAKSILWLGTSIPHYTPYPQETCEKLGYTCYNMALGSSGICLHEGVLGNGRDCYDLSESTEEKHARYDAYIGTSSYITEERIESGGYDKRIIPYINGTIASCDTVVFDHGYNDRLEIFNEMKNFDSINKSMFGEIDRTTYIGAFVFLLKKIWEVNPNIKIVICSYLESQSDENCPVGTDAPKLGKYICEYQKKIAEYFNIAYLPVCDYIGFHTHLVAGTENYLSTNYGSTYDIINYYNENNPNNCISLWQYYCPDGVHPHTDKFNRGKERIVQSLVKLMRDI